MTLPTTVLDDRTFQDLVDQAKRLIPKHCPEWTNHNLSDPGIALIELFAYMTEMTLYRLNQVPDKLYVKLLDLVGIDPFPPRAATTDLTFWLSPGATQEVVVPAGTEVGTRPTGNQLPEVFTTERDLLIVQPRLFAFLTSSGGGSYRSCWDALSVSGRKVSCFSRTPSREDAFYLGFRDPLASNVLQLEIVTSIEGLGVDPARVPLKWEVWSAAKDRWIDVAKTLDQTGGLNRSGMIRLVLPVRHDSLTVGPVGEPAFWVRGRLAPPEGTEVTYTHSPQISMPRVSSVGGSVPARHCRRLPGESLGTSDGSPGQAFRFRHGPVLPWQPPAPGGSAGDRVEVVSGNETTTWTVVADFSRATKSDRHVVWDARAGQLRFGPAIRDRDGTTRQHGAVPPRGSEIRVSGYGVGGGAAGNVGAGTLTALHTSFPLISGVENLQAARGGVDAESIENVKRRAPELFRAGDRAVTAADYERLARQVPGVARAACVRLGPGKVQVLVVPETDEEPERLGRNDVELSDELREELQRMLDERRTVGTSVHVTEPEYCGISVAAEVITHPDRSADAPTKGAADVQTRALTALYRYFDPRFGGSDGTGWPFEAARHADAAAVAKLLGEVKGIADVRRVVLFEAELGNGTSVSRRTGDGVEQVVLPDRALFLSLNHRVVVREAS